MMYKFISRTIKIQFKQISFVLLILALPTFSISAYDFAGFKMEYMNVENTGFYGAGFFTSNRRFDAEVEVLISSQNFSGSENKIVGTAYKTLYYSFNGAFHFIRTDSISYYASMGIFPLIPKKYMYHLGLGMDFYWSENIRGFYTIKRLFNNAEDIRYPSGIAFSAGMKFTWDLINF